jgi:hypothetical protein
MSGVADRTFEECCEELLTLGLSGLEGRIRVECWDNMVSSCAALVFKLAILHSKDAGLGVKRQLQKAATSRRLLIVFPLI